MRPTSRLIAALLFVLLAGLGPVRGQSTLLTRPSRHPMAETVQRFEAALRRHDIKIFGEIDHAAAARETGATLAPRVVILYGNPEAGTPLMQSTPTLAIDFPQRALVWQDDQGLVWLTINTAEDLAGYVFPRHGLRLPAEVVAARNALMAGIMDETLNSAAP